MFWNMPLLKILLSQVLVVVRVSWKTAFTEFFFPISFPCPSAEACSWEGGRETLIISRGTAGPSSCGLPHRVCRANGFGTAAAHACASTGTGTGTAHSTSISSERLEHG